jgi:hypothetical protein
MRWNSQTDKQKELADRKDFKRLATPDVFQRLRDDIERRWQARVKQEKEGAKR